MLIETTVIHTLDPDGFYLAGKSLKMLSFITPGEIVTPRVC